MSAASFMSQENYKRKNLQNFYLQNILLKKSGSSTLEKPVLNSLILAYLRVDRWKYLTPELFVSL